MGKDANSRRHDQAVAGVVTHPCRDRKRQLLAFVDDERAVSFEALMKAAEATTCAAGHEIVFADLMDSGTFEDNGLQELTLSRAGNAWLMDYGHPSSQWSFAHPPSLPALRDWQVEALDAWAEHARHGVVQAVTGTGKSRVGVEATREALRDDYSVLVCVPTVELVEQWIRSLKALGVPRVGRVGGENKATLSTHNVLVGTVQSLYLDPPRREDGKVLLIADECHRYGSPAWSAVLEPSYRRRLGLTATFERNDDGLTKLLHYFGGGPVFDIDFSRAIDEGVIAHYDVKLVGVELTAEERSGYDESERVLSETRQELVMDGVSFEPFGLFMHEVTQIAGDDNWHPLQDTARRYLKEFSRRAEVVSNAASKFEVMGQIAPLVGVSNGALVFTRRVDTAEDLAERLVAAGVAARPIHSDLTRTERQERLGELRRGSIKALVAPTVLDEGVDVPAIDVAVVMGGSKSRRQMIQRMGRVLRLKKDGGKATFVVVYAKNTVEDITMNSGVEGCLDLITASADTVQHLNPKTMEEVEAVVSQVPPQPAQVVVQVPEDVVPDPPVSVAVDVGDAGISSVTEESGAGVGAGDVDAGSEAASMAVPLDLGSVSLTRLVLSQHIAEHRGSAEDAAAEIAQMVEDFTSEGRWLRDRHGNHVVRRAEYMLVVHESGDRFIRYQSGCGSMNWSKFRTRGDDAVWAQRPVPRTIKSRPHLVWTSPSDFAAQVSPERIAITMEAFRGGARVLGLLGRSVEDEDADRALRAGFSAALAESRLSQSKDGVVCAGAGGIDWVLSPDGCTLKQVRIHRLEEAPVPQGQPHSVTTAQPPRAMENVPPRTGAPAAPVPRHRAEFTSLSVPEVQVSAANDLVTQIERLAILRNEGLLTDDEFSAAKARLIF